ncbi:MAG TPA: sialic acid TRAP transporter substrate-binding protein SiaP [Usitatibacter sp.]|jgi:tripartite ATP-independent transporter DctP family solute receptor|nr:sialic acid TRAP transporter substrate-binding protein SiaP [Usitatibacter sp.]
MKIRPLGALALAALILAALPALAQTKLKWAHVYEQTEPYHTEALWASQEVKKRTNGRYEIDVFPASTLGKETDINQALSLGTIDIIYTGMAFAGRAYPPMSIASAPFIFRDFDHWQKFREGPVFKELARGYEDKTGHHIVGYTYYGQRHLTANKMVTKPEDMKGMKLRVPDAPLFMMFPRAVGANPTPIAFAEVYLALQNGTVDAQENPLPTIDAKKFYEVQKYIILTGHITESLVTIVAGDTWKKLSEADRKVFSDVLWEASTRATREIADSESRLAADFEKRGKTVVKVDRGPFIKAVLPAVTAPDAPWPRSLYDRIEAIR